MPAIATKTEPIVAVGYVSESSALFHAALAGEPYRTACGRRLWQSWDVEPDSESQNKAGLSVSCGNCQRVLAATAPAVIA